MFKNDALKTVLAGTALIIFWLLGYGLSQYIALPATLLGLLLLLLGLICLGRVPTALAKVSQFCLRHLSLFFIPPLVAAWFYAEQMGNHLWLFLLAIILSTFVSLCLTSWLGQRLFKGHSQAANQDNDE